MMTTHTISIKTTLSLAEVVVAIDNKLRLGEFVCGAKNMQTYYWIEVYCRDGLDWVADLIPNTGTAYGQTSSTHNSSF